MSRFLLLWRRLFLLSCLGLLMPACAVLQPSPQTPAGGGDREAFAQRVADLSALKSWRVKARMASGVIGWSGQLDWRQQESDLLVTLAGPLGVGGFRAVGTVDYVKVETSEEEAYAGDPDELFNALVGWPFPVKGMRYWAMGIPMPATRSRVEVDSDGMLRVLAQAGWLVEYLEYREYLGHRLPRKMRMEKGDIKVRVVIDNWQEISG